MFNLFFGLQKRPQANGFQSPSKRYQGPAMRLEEMRTPTGLVLDDTETTDYSGFVTDSDLDFEFPSEESDIGEELPGEELDPESLDFAENSSTETNSAEEDFEDLPYFDITESTDAEPEESSSDETAQFVSDSADSSNSTNPKLEELDWIESDGSSHENIGDESELNPDQELLPESSEEAVEEAVLTTPTEEIDPEVEEPDIVSQLPETDTEETSISDEIETLTPQSDPIGTDEIEAEDSSFFAELEEVEESELDSSIYEPSDSVVTETDEGIASEADSSIGDSESEPFVNEETETNSNADELEDSAILETEETIDDSETEENDLVANAELSNLKPQFESGTFRVGETGEVEVDFLFDGGAYKGEVAIVSLSGMEGLDPTSQEFFLESISRAASNSELGYIIINDSIEGARFSGDLGEADYNSGEYQGVKSFAMRPGDEFFLMLVPNGTLQQVLDNPNAGGAVRPLFSLATANPEDGYHFGQIADIIGDGSAFAWEDIRIDGGSDRDYNDIVLQFRGATGKAALMDDVVAAGKDWRGTELGQELINYVNSQQPEEPIAETPEEPVAETPEEPQEPQEPVAETPEEPQEPVAETPEEPQEPEEPVAETPEEPQEPEEPVAETPEEPQEPVAETPEEPEEPVAETPEEPQEPVAETPEEPQEPEAETPEEPQEPEAETPEEPQEPEEPVSMERPFTEQEIVKDDWERSTAYAEGETEPDPDVPDTVDPATVINLGNLNRDAFLENQLNSQEDGLGETGVTSTNFSESSVEALPQDGFGNVSNQAPVVTTYNQTLNPGTSIAGTDLFTVYDPDGDAIQWYWLYDYNSNMANSSTSGYFTLNGIKQNNGFSINESQLATVEFVAGSESGTDKIYIQAYDGTTWSESSLVMVTTELPNQAPVVSLNSHPYFAKPSVDTALDFFTVTDPDGDPITLYAFSTSSVYGRNGYLTVDGVAQDHSWFTVEADQLDQVNFVSTTNAGYARILVKAYDGQAWSDPVQTTVNIMRSVTADDFTLEVGSSISVQDFLVEDTDTPFITRYWFEDTNKSSTSGYFTVNGIKQNGTYFTVDADQLDTVHFVAGAESGDDGVRIRPMTERGSWSGHFTNLTITTEPANQVPEVTTYNQTLNPGTSLAASEFFTVYDADGDEIEMYYFYDINGNSTSGYFTLNGVEQTGAFTVTASQLGMVQFVAGSQAATDSVYIYAYDGKIWSGYSNVILTTEVVNHAPVVTTYNQTLNPGTSLSASDFFSVYDADGDAIEWYYFYDTNSNSTSGYFTLNGVEQTSGFAVTASQLGMVQFVAGSQAATDPLYVYAHDGKTWSEYSTLTLTTEVLNRAPEVTTYNQTVNRSESIIPYFTVTDADGDTITRYALYDGNTHANSGYFTIDGVKQEAGQIIYVDANQLSQVEFIGGASATTEQLYIAASDGKAWSSWSNYTVQTQPGSTPTVVINNATVDVNTSTSLTLNVSDLDGDTVTRYEFFDSNAQSTSGYFTVNGVQQEAGKSFFVDADQLHTVQFIGGAAAGSDRIAIRATDGIDGWGNWSYAEFTTEETVTYDWFDLNIKDTTIRALARSNFQDGILCRHDMIDIFDSAKNNGFVSTDQLADLQLLSSDVTYIQMADHARILSQKIAHGDITNQQYLGQSLGNLYEESSATHLQKLIDKHFFGKDLPGLTGDYAYGKANDATYKFVQGELFQDGIDYTDVRQGYLGDCYYLAALAGIAMQDSQKIEEMFIDNGDGTYTVRFFNNGTADYVTVNRLLPTLDSGQFIFASVGGTLQQSWWSANPYYVQNTYNNVNNELWVALAEKAYAQINEAAWIGQDGTNSYKGIEEGRAQVASEHIAEVEGKYHDFSHSSVAAAIAAFTAGSAVFFSSDKNQHGTLIGSDKLVGGHAYLLTSYDSVNKTVTLFNPWNSGNSYDKDGYLTVSWNEVSTYFYAWREAS
ncbi:DUF4114 domain-containing protein [Oscillatoria acuminata]|uniref:Calpain family cysteine protease n=1 Tax=Oscillatoria acuminata PCC 6304 TaxID=56110 RepID=K9TN70_9CYAN|nr:DUF4114 domain-containing protein [Oscillatoria acuminata]AFY83838.1 Calpain family cysteine protease [Oscillatoria acuminata PCC 6304]